MRADTAGRAVTRPDPITYFLEWLVIIDQRLVAYVKIVEPFDTARE
jgi:hypothetical protein